MQYSAVTELVCLAILLIGESCTFAPLRSWQNQLPPIQQGSSSSAAGLVSRDGESREIKHGIDLLPHLLAVQEVRLVSVDLIRVL